MSHLSLNTPLGFLSLFEDDDCLVAVEFGRAPDGNATPLLEEARAQIEAYFDGDTVPFDLPMRPEGTPFQKRVWQRMRTIPYGATIRYGDIAKELATASRAVGTACGRNPLPIVIPCHRVVGSAGALGGYSGGDGVATKIALLRLEGALAL